jgi:hypothetical protein
MASINRRDLVKVVRAKLGWDSEVYDEPWTKLNVGDPNFFLPFLDAACKRTARNICRNHKDFDKMGLVDELKAHVATDAAFRGMLSAKALERGLSLDMRRESCRQG